MLESELQSVDAKIAVLLFEFGVGGHFPNYLRLLIEHWHEQGFGRLHIITTRRFQHLHGNVLQDIGLDENAAIRCSTLEPDEENVVDACRNYSYGHSEKPDHLLKKHHGSISWYFWTLVQKYGAMFPAQHILLMNLDECLIALSAGERAPADFSGIFFRPGFQYRETDQPTTTKLDAFGALQERLVVERLLKHPQLRNAFFLDRTVTERLKELGTTDVVYLPDPVRLPDQPPSESDRARCKSEFGIPAERRLFLLFGDIAPRKGVLSLLETMRTLSEREQRSICLAIVGSSAIQYEQRLAPHWEALALETEVQVIRKRSYVSDDEVHRWFTAATVIVAPYVRHVGMSGILLLAAAHGRPILSQEFGLMGQLTRDHGLGLTINPSKIDSFAQGLRAFLAPELPPEWNPGRAVEFALQHSHEQFSQTLFDAIRKHAH